MPDAVPPPDEFLDRMRRVQDALGGGRPDEGNAAAADFLNWLAETAAARSDPNLDDYGVAGGCAAAGDWAGAEAAYQRIIARAADNPVSQWQAWCGLAELAWTR